MKTNIRSFAGGEITPELYGRLDLTKYQTGLSLCRNFVVLPHGPIARRPGTEYGNLLKDPSNTARLIPFQFSASDSVVLEFGDLYVRFHTQGQPVLEASQSITSIVGATVNKVAHGYSINDELFIGGRAWRITTAAANSFTVVPIVGLLTDTPSGSTMARIYTLASPYAAAVLRKLRFTQSADVVSITCPGELMRELRRSGATSWAFRTVTFAPTLQAPGGVTATATAPTATGLTEQRYVVTAVGLDDVTESVASAQAGATITTTTITGYDPDTGQPISVTTSVYIGNSATNNLNIAGNFNTITWTNTSDALRYNVYKLRGGVYGYIGQGTDGAVGLIDDNILPDTTKTPPDDLIALNTSTTDRPTAVAYYEQRRWLAGTTSEPATIWATRSGTESNLTSSLPSQDDDALKFKIASTKQSAIQHLVPLNDMLALTSGGAFRVFSPNAPVITPTSVNIKPQSAVGASDVQPVVVDQGALYVQATGSRLREIIQGGQEANYGYRTRDTTLLSPHLFNGYTILDMAYTGEPDRTAWLVRSDGALLGMTYLPDQQVYAWHQHVTDGVVESVCSVSENNIDVLYLTVRRDLRAGQQRTIERMVPRIFVDPDDAHFVDCGLTYRGSPATTITGLWHLEGRTVSILADAAVQPNQVVANGQVTLDTASSVVHIGLAYTSDATTLPLVLEGMMANGQGTMKNISEVFIRVTQSSVVQAGPGFSQLTTLPTRAVSDPYGSPPALRTGELRIKLTPQWGSDGPLCVRQDLPLPLTVLSLSVDTATGG